ncbi:hypothetical protein J4212_00420, partial [Candidatus Woesearchaeota archaeon]|nr:hypothetical protein [Candidatus Woesearchaeota archaeon]
DQFSIVSNCSIIINNTINKTSTSITKNTRLNFTIYNFSDGHHSWRINCTDFLGNVNTTPFRIAKTDKTAPTVSLNKPINFQNISSSTFKVNATATDAGSGVNKTVFQYRAQDSGAWTQICNNPIGLQPF